MPLSNYTELVSAITDFLEWDALDSRVPTMVRLAESQFERKLRVREMQTVLAPSFNAATYALPADFREIAAIALTGSPRGGIDYLPPDVFEAHEANNEGPGRPRYCTILGTNLHLAPAAPSTGIAAALVYWGALPALSDASPTNWLLTRAPDLYFFASLCELELYTMNDARAELWKARRDEAIDELNGNERRMRSRGAGQQARRVS